MRFAHPQILGVTAPRRLGLLLSCALWLSAPRPALAAEGTGRRVLLIEQGRDPFLERVGAELEGLGFSLVRNDAKDSLEASARGEQAVAAIRVLPSRKGVEVWMADATSGRSLLRQVVVDESPRGPDHDLIALQTAELLRTSLLGEKSPRERPVEAAKAPQHDVPPTAPRSDQGANDTGVQLACGALYSPGGPSAAVELGVSLHRFFAERWGVALDLGMPLRPGAITQVEGSAKMGAYFAGALLLARFQRRPSPFFATAGAGPALLFVRYDGEARPPLRSSSGSRWMGTVYLRGDAGIEVATWLRLGLRALVGASFQRTSVTFAGSEAGNFGPALFAGFAFAEISLP